MRKRGDDIEGDKRMNNIEALLEAAKFLEQQETTKLPISTINQNSPPNRLNHYQNASENETRGK